MRTLLLPLLITVISTLAVKAQYSEVGLHVGAANYSGDLSNGTYRPSQYRPALGVFGRYNHNPRLAAKASLTIGELSGSDASSGNAKTRVRNLSFESPLVEVAAMGEFNVMPYAIRNNQGASVYLTAGVAGFYFNPRAEFNGQYYALQPLGTEGQGSLATPELKRYSRVGFAIPFGGGVKFSVSDRVNLGFEFVVRRTFTDYLDDVSGDYPDLEALYAEDPLAAALSFRATQFMLETAPIPSGQRRGNPDVKDYYMTALLSLSFNLTTPQGLDFDSKYEIFKTPPADLSAVQDWTEDPRA